MTETVNNDRALSVEESYAKGLPELCGPLWLRANSRACPPRAAIKAKCQSCVGYEDVISRVRDCQTWKCPLWAYRPYQEKRK